MGAPLRIRIAWKNFPTRNHTEVRLNRVSTTCPSKPPPATIDWDNTLNREPTEERAWLGRVFHELWVGPRSLRDFLWKNWRPSGSRSIFFLFIQQKTQIVLLGLVTGACAGALATSFVQVRAAGSVVA